LVVEGALSDLGDTPWERASDDELMAAARDLECWSRQLYSVALAITAELDSRGVAASRGATSTAVLLRQLLRISPGQARRRVADAREVCPTVTVTGEVREPALPAAAAALASGAISDQHLKVIRQTLHDLPPGATQETRAGVEATLVGDADHFDPVQLGKVAQRIRAHLDPDGTLLEERQAVARRELSFTSDLDGTVLLRGRLDAEGAAIVQAALSPLAAPAPADAAGVKDPRSPARRRADALIQAARMLLDAGDLPTQGGQRPHLAVTIRLSDLSGQSGAADLDTTGGLLTAAAARRTACDANLIPLVLGANSEPLDVGRASYTVPAPMRRALIVRDKGCAFPGCDRPPTWDPPGAPPTTSTTGPTAAPPPYTTWCYSATPITAWHTPKTGTSASSTATPNSPHPAGSTRTENHSATPCTILPNAWHKPRPAGPNHSARPAGLC
jgi:hypothetical protein